MTKKTRKRIEELEKAVRVLKFKIEHPNGGFEVDIECTPIFHAIFSDYKEYTLHVTKIYNKDVIQIDVPLGVHCRSITLYLNGEYIELYKGGSPLSSSLLKVIKIVSDGYLEIPIDLYVAVHKPVFS